jgi:predicted MFS family arabinose efflux permease
MGFGLFVPEFRSEFSMSSSAVGFVSSLGFLGFFIGLLVAQALLARRGPGFPVVVGLACATAGMGLIAMAPGLPVLAFGVFLAASSAGLAWTPFNDAVHRKVDDWDRPTALSAVSTGTGVGIAMAGFIALGMHLWGLPWRFSWAVFVAAGVAALLVNALALRKVEKADDNGPGNGWRDLLRAAAIPLFVIGLVFGATTAIYISFAADHMVTSGGVPGLPVAATPALVYICYGLVGLTGLLTGRIKEAIGLPLLLRLLMLAGALSVALVAVAPDSWAGLVLSAGLQGVYLMMISAVLAFWSERLFPSLPSLGFTAVLLAAAAGNVLGPLVAGMVSDALGARAMFLGAAVLPALTAVLLRDRHARERPVATA